MANETIIGGQQYKLQVFGGNKRINGFYVHAMGQAGQSGMQLVVTVPVVPDPKPQPSEGIKVIYVPGPKGGALRVVEAENEFVVLKGPSGTGFWNLTQDNKVKSDSGIGESVEGEKWVIQKNRSSASFLGFNEDEFPGSGGWVASRIDSPVIGVDNYAISWLSPGTASMEMIKEPIPIRISLVNA